MQAGDEVIVPAFTFVATAMAVLHQGAVPVFVDVEPQFLGMDPAKVEAAIGPRTRAIVPVHLHGVPCDLQPIADIAARRGLLLIEDSAQAIGARYRGRFTGTLGSGGVLQPAVVQEHGLRRGWPPRHRRRGTLPQGARRAHVR